MKPAIADLLGPPPKGPDAWLAYLRPFEEGEQLIGPNILVILNLAAGLAKKEVSLDWAEVAVRAAELGARSATGAEREWLVRHEMNTRCWFISKKGSRRHHVVLDKESILQWINEGLPASIKVVKEKVSALEENFVRWKRSSNSDERQLFRADLDMLCRIRDRLRLAKMLADCGEIPGDSTLHEWIAILGQLPSIEHER